MGIRRFSVARHLGLVLLSATAIAAGLAACGSDTSAPSPTPAAGAGGAQAGGAGSPAAGAPSAGAPSGGAAPSAGAGGAGTAGSPAAGAGGAAVGGSAGASGAAGSAGASAGAGGGGNGVTPQCLTPNVQFGVDNATNKYIECDFEMQSIEFDQPGDFTAGKGPGYDPAMTPASFTSYGSAFTGSAVQMCHPYCWKGNLTVGISFTPGSDASTRGEALLAFPPSVVIADANGRNSLGWIWVDGPDLPAGSTLNAQMVLKSSSKGLLVANDTKKVTLKTWVEFKYFAIQTGFNAADLKDITHIGFRLTLTPNTAAAWSGVVYADHFELRQ